MLDRPGPARPRGPRRHRPLDRSRAAPVLALVVLVVAVVAGALALSGGDGDTGGEAPSGRASLPEPLDRALDELESAVQP